MKSKTSQGVQLSNLTRLPSLNASSPIRFTAPWSVTLLFSDLIVLVFAAYLGGGLFGLQSSKTMSSSWHLPVIFIGFFPTIFYTLGLYRRSLAASFKDEFYFTAMAGIFGFVPLLMLFTIVPPLRGLRSDLLITSAVAILLLGMARSTLHIARVAIEGRQLNKPGRVIVNRNSPSTSPTRHGVAVPLGLQPHASMDRSMPFRICRPTAMLSKRSMDIVFASLALLIAAPVMAVAAVMIWVDSGRPVFFLQDRVGKFGRVFRIIKFRTMKAGAGLNWAEPSDDRITKVGALLRRTSIDELPQLLNVLGRDMSLVGPRPEMCSFERVFAERIPLYTERRLAVPGMTGWAQVNMKRNLSPEDVEKVLGYDLFYIENWSLFLDCTILLKTATEFLFHRAV
jgi:lipopolysaccharide/colanic/teichoic acid biosynthesis glycosyltransferase